MTAIAPAPDDIAAIRRFNRFYTRAIGLLGPYLDSPWSLTEARVLYELFAREGLTAATLCTDLGLDAGYLSRMLKAFEAKGLVARTADPADRRRSLIAMTAAGRAASRPFPTSTRSSARARSSSRS